ncbi:hypothetical protein BU26DRAFT_594651 [Trematosphaeria pertusa]|uniref:Uncharacterized protein n=1 Tax=Trematosphaeria pertusa TaxID=390896 RepID=A0A6A6IFR7_9PLEO|nr:uncharacterized protein BU26DRAFT_594651 [Trematosphaeria pertusa]KAF2248928.1 hypothetical protein BU26DRAFT_594651 [Trematosphaeria pertusa]
MARKGKVKAKSKAPSAARNKTNAATSKPARPSDLMAYWVDENGIPHNRHNNMSEAEKVAADEVDYGFGDVSYPSTPEHHTTSTRIDDFPYDDPDAIDEITDTLERKLRLLRNSLLEQVNNPAFGKKPTSEDPIAQAFANPEQPFPISFMAQDLVRLILHHASFAPEVKKEKEEKKLTNKNYQRMIDQNTENWVYLRSILADLLPGNDGQRRDRAEVIMKDVLEEELVWGAD